MLIRIFTPAVLDLMPSGAVHTNRKQCCPALDCNGYGPAMMWNVCVRTAWPSQGRLSTKTRS